MFFPHLLPLSAFAFCAIVIQRASGPRTSHRSHPSEFFPWPGALSYESQQSPIMFEDLPNLKDYSDNEENPEDANKSSNHPANPMPSPHFLLPVYGGIDIRIFQAHI